MTKKTEEEIIEIVLDESRKLQSKVNGVMLETFAKLHNIDLEHSYFDAKQEVVAKKAYFPGPKKKYILQLCNQEGVPVDEQDVKGLIMRRSDYPQITKIRIQEIFDLLLKTDKVPFTQIKNLIETTREELMNLIIKGDRSIARPSSFKKELHEYKAMPMHIAGMLLWNKLEYNHFKAGTKGYLYKISGVDTYSAPPEVLKKLSKAVVGNVIVIPEEVEKIPPYYIIDKKEMIAFAWDDRVSEIISPIAGQIYKKKQTSDALLTW